MAFKTVIVCEKVNQANFFQQVFKLGSTITRRGFKVGYYDETLGIAVVAQSGHLLEAMPPEHYEERLKEGWNLNVLPVLPNNLQLQLKKAAESRFQERIYALYEAVKWALVDSGSPGEIAIAADNDKEGELLSWEMLVYLGVDNHPNITRLFYSQINLNSMKEAFEKRVNARDWFDRYLAGLARFMADWMIGMNVTMGLTANNKENLPPRIPMNAGRVIFAMNYILVLRHYEIINFIETRFYKIEIEQQSEKYKDLPFKGHLIVRDEWLTEVNGSNFFSDKSIVERIYSQIKSSSHTVVTSFIKEPKTTPPPLGFSRTDIDIFLGNAHSIGLDQSAPALQSLYSERGLITYPRVDVCYLDISMHPQMPQHIEAIKSNIMRSVNIPQALRERYAKIFGMLDMSRKSNMFAKGIDAGEAHHAIIPTAEHGNLDALNGVELQIYLVVVDRLLMQFMPDYEYSSTIVETELSPGISFLSKGTTPIRLGWRALNPKEDEDDDADDNDKIPPLSIGDKLVVSAHSLIEKATKKPKHYSETEFIKVLENPRKFVKNEAIMKKIKTLQIGTSATRNVHVQDLPKRGLVSIVEEKKGKKVVKRMVSTGKALALDEIAPPYMKYPEMSAYWEDAFNSIQSGELDYRVFVERQQALINKFIDECRAGKYKMTFSPYPHADCRAKKDDVLCKGKAFRRFSSAKNKYFWFCSVCDAGYADNDGVCGDMFGARQLDIPPGAKHTDCPKCKEKIYRIERASSKGKNYWCWHCPSCKANFFDDNSSIGSPFGEQSGKKTPPKKRKETS